MNRWHIDPCCFLNSLALRYFPQVITFIDDGYLVDRLSIHQLWQSCVLRILLQLSPCFFQSLVSCFIGIARFQIFQLHEVGMGNLRETGEIRNHRQVAITTVQLHFLDDVVITTMVEISGDETLQIALCLDAGVNTCTVPVTLGDVFR